MIAPRTVAGLLGGGWASLTFCPFRDGVQICRLLTGKPDIAVLKYAPGARVPLHEHPEPEMIIVLDGAQSDENGTYKAGDMTINPAGSRHSVWSDTGCVVLLHWSAPVLSIPLDC